MEAQRDVARLLDELAGRQSEAPLVSLYFEASPQPDRLGENAIRLKNVLKDAAGQLEARGVAEAEVRKLRKQVQDAASAWEDGSGLDRGIGIFTGEDELRSIALPYPVDETAVVGSHYFLKPLFRALDHRQDFWLLALSQNRVSLYRGDGFGLHEVDTGDDVPDSLRDVAGYEPAGKALHFHAVETGGDEAKWHGRGAGRDDVDAEIHAFLREVDQGLQTLWQRDDAPVVLAGVADLLASYRDLSACRDLLEEQVEGNVESWTEDELHERAWPLVSRRAEEQRLEVLDDLTSGNPDVPVARQLPDVLRAAVDGRVDTAFLAVEERQWGQYDMESREVALADDPDDPSDEDDELLDRAAVATRQNGGTVCLVPRELLPEPSVAMARLRY